MKVILASQSPRRQELLKLIFNNFAVMPAEVDESIPENIAAPNAAEYLAVKKAAAVASEHTDALVIGADTIVLNGGEILGKPENEAEAMKMLSALSGHKHSVITGCAIYFGGRHLSFSECTEVEFLPITQSEIKRYVESGEPMDKAGAYGIQGGAALFVKGIEGDYFNVVGLPVASLNRNIKKFLAICGVSYEKE